MGNGFIEAMRRQIWLTRDTAGQQQVDMDISLGYLLKSEAA